MNTPSLDDFYKARTVLSQWLSTTPLVRNEWLSNTYGCNVFLKLETAQPIGSFKIRGATNSISKLTAEERARGVVAASAGNHAQGVAWGSRVYGVNALIVMPENAPLMKIANTQNLGATVHLEGKNYDESYAAAMRISKETGRVYIHAFHDGDVIAGQGTLALEILEQCPDVDVIVSSMGGGGLTAGIGLVVKKLKPSVQMVAAQSAGARSMVASLGTGQLVQTGLQPTFADGIAVSHANEDLFQILKNVVDLTFTADDEEIAKSVLTFIEKTKTVTEGGAAIVLGALERFSKSWSGKNVVLVICGGNIDVNLLSRIIDRGLTRSGRRLRLDVLLSDKPGSLALLTAMLAENKVNILQTIHDRDEPKVRIDQTEVHLTLETRGPEHSEDIVRKLMAVFPAVKVVE